MGPTPRASVLLVSYNTRELLLEAIESVIGEPDVEVIVFDNASSDDSPQSVARRFPGVQLICSNANLGFAAGMNRAAACATGKAFLLLNSDATMQPGALHVLLEMLDQHPRAALIGPALRYPDGRPQPAAFRFPGLVQTYLDLFPIDRLTDSALNGRIRAPKAVRIDHPLGACMLIRRQAWQEVGPLDEGYFMYMEEVDWCRRAHRKGWEIWQQPAAIAVHHGGASTRQQPDAMLAQLWRSRLRYYARFHSPAYNRAIHLLVRLGLRNRRSASLQSVRHLAS